MQSSSLSITVPWNVRAGLGLLRAPLVAELGADRADAVLAAAGAAVVPLLAALPPLPPRRVEAARFLAATAYLGGLFRALRAEGLPAAQAGALVVATARATLERVPRPARAVYRWYFFRPRTFRALAASVLGDPAHGDGQPGDFAGTVEEVGYGVTYSGCALRSFLTAQGLGEFAPWVCLLDDVQSEVFGLGLERTGTLAHGAARCDFRWVQGGRGRALPPPGNPAV